MSEAHSIPDPQSAARALETARAAGVRDEAALGVLERVAGVSRLLGRFLAARPEVLRALHSTGGNSRSPQDHLRRARADRKAAAPGPDGLASALRIYRHRETARVLLRDLDGASVLDVSAEIADIASACFEVAIEDSTSLASAGGELPVEEGGAVIPFTVMGMGKLGGRELNYSSDVDVIYVYGTDRGATPDGSKSAHEAWTRIASRVTRALADVTEEGNAFRVDLDLRPEGTRGPMVNSLRSLEVYYESYGQTWERAVWLKGRPVAGDAALGANVLASLEPFVYRRWLDYATIEAFREMKSRIDRQRNAMGRARLWDDSSMAGFHVKLGSGGIRELEFLVQTLQLINAGKRPELRSRGTLESLAKLAAAGLVDRDEAVRLAEAYEFLRRLEHRLQARELAQTHSLPTDPAELEVISASMGFDRDPADLLRTLERHRAVVGEAFDGLFLEKTRTAAAESGPETALLTEPDLEPTRARELTGSLALFGDVESTADAFARIRRGPTRSRQKESAYRYLARIATPLFGELKESADPDAAVRNLEGFLSKIGGRTTLLALLAEHPPTVKLLVRLFGTSDYLASAFIARPELIDVLLGAGFNRPVRTRAELRAESRAVIRTAPDFEAQLEGIRRFRTSELLRIALADLWGGTSIDDGAKGRDWRGGEPASDVTTVMRQLSDLADAVLQSCLETAAREGEDTRGFVVLALGRLGGREMAYGSDVDLVFLYDPDRAADRDHAHERFLKLAQRFVSAVASPMREGIAYRVDTRLRPSGSSGPLVASMSAFRNYHLADAHTWERQALLRARPVAGDSAVWRRARREVVEVVLRRPVDPSLLASDILEMRERMEKQIGGADPSKYNLKSGRGGLVDVEFSAQFLQLAYAGDDPAARSTNTLTALRRARRRNRLAETDFESLRRGYLFLNHLENRMRIVEDAPVDELPARDPSAWSSLARRARMSGESGETAIPDGVRLRETFERVTAAVRDAFVRVLGVPAEPGG